MLKILGIHPKMSMLDPAQKNGGHCRVNSVPFSIEPLAPPSRAT
jgi:hypothetical protein